MIIYAVVVIDRHVDPKVFPFTSKWSAISEARRIAKEYSSKYPEDYKELNFDEWEFAAEYSCESDMVVVIEKEVDLKIEE